jgi:hypothetical protein
MEPEDGGVQRAKDRASDESGLGGNKFAGTNPGGNHLPEALFIAVALGKQPFLQRTVNGISQQMGCGALNLVKNAVQMKRNHRAEFFSSAHSYTPRFIKISDQPI